MTLVASYSVDNWPVVVGDIMLSNRPPQGELRAFNIPTHDNINELALPATGRIVSGLVQKLTVLTPKLAVAWAGSPLCAAGIFKDVRETGEDAGFDELCKVIDEWKNETGLDLYLTGLGIVEQSGSTTATCRFAWDSDLGWESRKESIEHYGDCYVGGSGGDMFCNLLQNGEFVFTSHAPSLEKAIVLSLSHLTTLVGDQLRRGSGVKLLYGGGFEVATLLGNQIQKITNVTFHFWSATKNDQSELQVTFRFALKVSYFEDYLVLRRFQIAGPVETILITTASATIGLELILHHSTFYAISAENQILNNPEHEAAFCAPSFTTFRAAS